MMKLSLVLPCYNEQDALPATIRRLVAIYQRLRAERRIDDHSEILFVDDGSRDATWALIVAAARDCHWVRGIKLSRNRGHQAALMAGLSVATGEAVISLDADLQDDPTAIEHMIAAYQSGADIVYGVRKKRATDTTFKRATAWAYYWLLARLGVEIVFDHADYRLLSRRALEALKQYEERNLFLRAIVPQLGYPSAIVYYERAERRAGASKYSPRKMLSFAWQGITSFSSAPLRIITALGLIVSCGSFVIAAWALWVRFWSASAVPGWASTVLPMYLIGGIQLLCLGIIGEYLAKIYLEVKRRPAFFIEDKTP